MNADLHCHTSLSDGSLGIEEVIVQAKNKKIDLIAITDHDTLSSMSRAAVLGKRHGVEVIPGVEFSAFDGKRGTKAHLLCYNPRKPDRLEGLCLRTCASRKANGLAMAKRVTEKYPISLDNIVRHSSGSKAIFKCHIMHTLMDYGYTVDLYGSVYNEIFSADGGLCADLVREEGKEYPDVKFVSKLIRSAGGIAVLAHPKVYGNMELLEELAAEELIDGVEVWHSSADFPDSEYIPQMLEIAAKYNLITTGGSDFHGFYNHYPISLGHYTAPVESVERILQKKELKV